MTFVSYAAHLANLTDAAPDHPAITDEQRTVSRAELDRLAEAVRTALADRRWGDLTAACNELSDVLFYLEDV